MAKTLQEQYNQIKKGKGSKEIFLKEAKRLFPNMIHVASTYNQATKILKQRAVISEHMIGAAVATPKKTDWFKIFDENVSMNEEVKVEEKETSKEVKDVLSSNPNNSTDFSQVG